MVRLGVFSLKINESGFYEQWGEERRKPREQFRVMDEEATILHDAGDWYEPQLSCFCSFLGNCHDKARMAVALDDFEIDISGS